MKMFQPLSEQQEISSSPPQRRRFPMFGARVFRSVPLRITGIRALSSSAAQVSFPSGSHLSHIIGPTDVHLKEHTIGTELRFQAANVGNLAPCISVPFQGVSLNWGELLFRAERFAAGLLQLGFSKGDRIGIWMPNCHEWMVCTYASAITGMVLVNVNPHNREDELKHALNLVGCKGLLVYDHLKDPRYLETLSKLCPELVSGRSSDVTFSTNIPTLSHVIVCGADQYVSKEMYNRVHCFEDVYASETKAMSLNGELRTMENSLRSNEPINIQFTSGTTGLPKAATLTHRNVLNNGFVAGERMKLSADDNLCIPVPLYHCFGTVLGNLACMTHGASQVYPSFSFDAAETLAAVEKEKCTGLHGVPTMFIAELALKNFADYDLQTLRTGIMAGSACPESLMRKVVKQMYMKDVTIAYGMTETSPVSFQTYYDADLEAKVTTLGSIHDHVECKVVDPETGDIVPMNKVGELCTKGYNVMSGYWEQKDKTREVIDEDGFMHTGDLVTMDEKGFARFVGRSKDVIIRGGENIAPVEVEECIHRHVAAVKDVSVIGVADPKYGERVCAFVIPADHADRSDISAEYIREMCREHLAPFKLPQYVVVVDEFPLTVTGKHQKFKMRENAETMIANGALKQVR